MFQVSEHHEILYELDTKLLIINKMLISTMESVSQLHFRVTIIIDIYTGIKRLTAVLFGKCQ